MEALGHKAHSFKDMNLQMSGFRGSKIGTVMNGLNYSSPHEQGRASYVRLIDSVTIADTTRLQPEIRDDVGLAILEYSVGTRERLPIFHSGVHET